MFICRLQGWQINFLNGKYSKKTYECMYEHILVGNKSCDRDEEQKELFFS